MVRTPDEDLKRELQDPEYVKLYGASDCKAEIAITLCKARQSSGKTQKELAASMNLSQPYVAKLEGGEANPTIGTIGSILAVLGCRLITNTMPLIPEPEPMNIKIWSAAGISANEAVGEVVLQHKRSGQILATEDYSWLSAATAAIVWPPSEAEEHRTKITVGGTV